MDPHCRVREIKIILSEANEKNSNPWVRWLKRLGGTFDVIFTGPHWREKRKELWEKFRKGDDV